MQSSPLQRICDRIANEHRKQACSKQTYMLGCCERCQNFMCNLVVDKSLYLRYYNLRCRGYKQGKNFTGVEMMLRFLFLLWGHHLGLVVTEELRYGGTQIIELITLWMWISTQPTIDNSIQHSTLNSLFEKTDRYNTMAMAWPMIM